MENHKTCSRCIYDEFTPSIDFDEDGICNYCHMIDQLIDEYGTGLDKGITEFNKILEKIKHDGRKKKI